MSYIPESALLRGLPYERAQLYGMPNIGAKYLRDDVDSQMLLPGAVCAVCGRKAVNSHHEPPKSNGRSFLLRSRWGLFVLKPALIALCGSGTTGCHGRRHERRWSVRWEWDADGNAEKWWDGWWLSHGFAPNSRKLFELGRYVFSDGAEWEVRL